MTLSRRAMLRIGVGAAAVIGLDLGGCAFAPVGSTLRRQLAATGALVPSAWLRIGRDGRITLLLDRVEMGQGTTTSHAMLVAEELEVAPAEIHVEPAPAAPAFVNPELQAFQVTGGSNSTRGSWRALRRTGAIARELLRRGAAATWGVPVAECRAADGAVHHDRSGRRAPYGSLVDAAAAQEVDDVTLKPARAFRWIGQPIDRLDARGKLDGSGVYGLDVRIPDMLTAVVVRPPVRGGRLRALDDRAARARRGVVDVVVIEAGVAVVGTGYWAARRGAAELSVTWDDGPLATRGTRAMRGELMALADQPGERVRANGDLERALARPARRIEATYEAPFLAHATLEPQNATARVTEHGCEIWAPTQAPGLAQRLAADRLGLPRSAVTVHTTLIGGGFGRRIQADYVLEAVELARALRRPVQVIWSREDDFANDFYRPMVVSRLVGGVAPGGEITGWHHRLVAPSIIEQRIGDFVISFLPDALPRAIRRVAHAAPRAVARGLVPDKLSAEGAGELPYAIPAIRVEARHAELGVPVGFWRSVGHSHTAFAVEGFLDELLHAAGRDPYAGRRALLADAPRLRHVLDVAARAAGWGQPTPAGVGRGIAVHSSFGSHCAQVVEAEVVGADIRVRRVVAALDCGLIINPQIVTAQIEGAIVFGLSAALHEEITFTAGRVEQRSLNDYGTLRMHQCPAIEVHLVPGDGDPQGVGEPGVPPVAPALAGAIFAATGHRLRRLPLARALAEVAR